jgi:hypothetical protein
MVSVRVAYPGIVHLGIEGSENGSAIGRNVADSDRKGVDGAGVVDINSSCRTTQC